MDDKAAKLTEKQRRFCERYCVVWNAAKAAREVGFRRFGIMGGAIHVDSDATKPRPTMWDYSNTKGTARMKLAKQWFESKLKG